MKCPNCNHEFTTPTDRARRRNVKLAQRATRKLTDDQVSALRWQAKHGVKPAQLAEQYGVARSTVYAIINNHRRTK